MTRHENKSYYHYLYDMSLIETIEFVFCDDTIIDYRDDIIVIGCPFGSKDEVIAFHGVVKC